MPDRPTTGEVEERTLPEAPAPTVDGRRLHGVIPYSTPSRDLGGWSEVVEPGALANADMSELVATVDHGGVPLGRFPDTLEVEDRDDGLHWSLEPPQSRADIREAVERGILRSTSWRMVVGRDEWRGDVRHVHEIAQLRDVAIVVNPAYAEARAELRAAPEPAPPTPEPAPEPPAPAPEPDPEPEEAPVPEVIPGGGVLVEDRAADDQNVETRVLEALRGVRKGESRALTTAVSVAPAEVGTYLFDRLRAASVGLSTGMTVLTTDRDSIVYPTLTVDAVPAWYAEAAPITPGDPTFATITGTPRKLAHLVQVSNEVLDDSIPSILDVLNQHLLRVLGLKLDIGLFQGSGTPPEIRGLANVAGIQTLTGVGALTVEDIADAIALLEAANAPRPYVVVLPPRSWSVLRKTRDASGGAGTGSFLLSPSPAADAPLSLFGAQVFVSSQLSITEGVGTNENSAFVYSPSEVVYVRRTEIELELDRSRLFNSDQSELRAKLRGDLVCPNPSAIVRLSGITG